jgi:hypothetical protein
MSSLKLLAMMAVCLPLLGADAPAKPLAVVNGQSVSRAELGRSLVPLLGRAEVKMLVRHALLAQAARRAGISLEDEDLDAYRSLMLDVAVRQHIESSRMTQDEYVETAKANDLTLDGLRQYHARRTVPVDVRCRLLTQEMLRKDMDLGDAAVKAYFERTRGDRFVAAHIEVPDRVSAEKLATVLRKDPRLWGKAVSYNSQDRASLPYQGRMRAIPAVSDLGKVLSGLAPRELKVHRVGENWHVFMFTSTVWATDENFEKVQDLMCRELAIELATAGEDALQARLMEDAEIVINMPQDPQAARILGDAVAFVDGEPISVDVLADALVDRFGENALPGYIERLLVFQAAERAKLVCTDAEADARSQQLIDEVIAARADERGISVAKLVEGVKDMEGYRRALLAQRVTRDDARAWLLAERLAAGDITVTPEDVAEARRGLEGRRMLVEEVSAGSAVAAELMRASMLDGVESHVVAAAVGADAWRRPIAVWITPNHPWFKHLKNVKDKGVGKVFAHGGRHHVARVMKRFKPGTLTGEALQKAAELQARRIKVRKRIVALMVKLHAEAEIEENP